MDPISSPVVLINLYVPCCSSQLQKGGFIFIEDPYFSCLAFLNKGAQVEALSAEYFQIISIESFILHNEPIKILVILE